MAFRIFSRGSVGPVLPVAADVAPAIAPGADGCAVPNAGGEKAHSEAPSGVSTGEAMDVAAAYDAIASKYDGEYLDAKHLAENSILKSMLGDGEFTKGKVLDIGCGTGLLLDLANISPDNYLGLDPSSGMLEIAREKYPRHIFFNGVGDDIPCASNGHFDSVVSLFGPMNYSKYPARIVAETHRVLRPGGRFFHMVYTPNRMDISYIIGEGEEDLYRKFFTNDSLRSYFQDAKKFTRLKTIGVTNKLEAFRGESAHYARFARFVGWAEINTLGRLNPDAFQYIIITGTKVA